MRSNALLSPRRAARFTALLQKAPAATVRTLQVAPRLLVRDGLHAGAWMTLRGAQMRLGRGDDCDIVLTDAGVPESAGAFVATSRGWHFRRAAEPTGAADDATADTTGPAPATTGPIVAPDTETQHARFRRRRWLLHGVTLVVIDIAALPAPVSERSVARLKYFAWAAGVTVIVAGGLLVLVFMVAPSLESKVVQARESLLAAGFRDVTLRRGDDRQIVLGGYVNDAAELTRLKAWMQGIVHLQVKLQVKSGQELAQRVRESVGETDTIKVSYQPPGRVRIEGSTASAQVKQRVQALVTEMKASVSIEDRLALVEPRQAPVNKPLPVRIVSVMSSGRTPYFVIDSGATYMQGSLLPDGSEVIAILPTKIFFRLGDRVITYPLDTASPLAKP
jgi:Inner membrane component of T3SS, cytoplasmic domain